MKSDIDWRMNLMSLIVLSLYCSASSSSHSLVDKVLNEFVLAFIPTPPVLFVQRTNKAYRKWACYSRRLTEKPHLRGFSALPQITGFPELTVPEEEIQQERMDIFPPVNRKFFEIHGSMFQLDPVVDCG
jgi:hypothetical protein